MNKYYRVAELSVIVFHRLVVVMSLHLLTRSDAAQRERPFTFEKKLIPQDVAALTQSQFADAEDNGAELFFEALKRRLDAEEPDYKD